MSKMEERKIIYLFNYAVTPKVINKSVIAKSKDHAIKIVNDKLAQIKSKER
jgi:hypothetical protein